MGQKSEPAKEPAEQRVIEALPPPNSLPGLWIRCRWTSRRLPGLRRNPAGDGRADVDQRHRDQRFEYEGQLYRSLTVIAERITSAHWSGPRFFGLTKRASAVVGAEAGR